MQDDTVVYDVLRTVRRLDQKQEHMIAGFKVMLDHIISMATVLESILEAVSAEPGDAENPLADALRELAAAVNENSRKIEAMPAALAEKIIDAMEDR